MNRYQRNLIGYGPKPPNANWPGKAKIAIQIVLNYEEGGESNILHGDASSEAFLSEITGAQPWPRRRHWNMESTYEYGARTGFWRLHRLLEDVPITVYGVATALARAPEQTEAMKEAGWEIASHGLKWIEYSSMTEDEERTQIREAIKLHTEVVGCPPRGWYTGRCSMNTVNLVARESDFAYIADSYADDLPYWTRVGDKDQLIVPYTLDCNDMRFAIQAGFTNGAQFESYLKDSFDVLYAEGEVNSPKMMSIGLHCRLAGRPGRIAALKRVLEYFHSHDRVWIATREQIADHWAKEHPPVQLEKPSEMDRLRFIEKFGGVYENCSWIADRAHALELGPTHDSPKGIHNALARIFRSADLSQRLEVLRAHSDLTAGKLASGKRLTAKSTAEQASDGLDVIKDAELKTFRELNESYTSKFGFPFIISVRDNTKSTILQSFQRRINNDRNTEFEESCRQVERIAELRIQDKFQI